MRFKGLYLAAVLVGAVSVTGCGDSSSTPATGGTGGNGTGGTGGSTGGEVCTLGICAEEGLAKTACLQAYNICIDAGENTPAECNTIAETANCEESNL